MKRIYSIGLCIALFTSVQAQDRPLKPGDIAPRISLLSPEGEQVNLSDMQGKLVLIDFWATWCAPCVDEQAELGKLYDKHQSSVRAGKFEIFGVSLDKDKSKWVQGLKEYGIRWPQGSDLKFWRSPVAKDYRIEELPFNVIVDEDGKIAAINLHGASLATFISQRLSGNDHRPTAAPDPKK